MKDHCLHLTLHLHLNLNLSAEIFRMDAPLDFREARNDFGLGPIEIKSASVGRITIKSMIKIKIKNNRSRVSPVNDY